ncbi:MAG: FkbM family methyltransferase, partial [Verrucomicrobiales bacterium]
KSLRHRAFYRLFGVREKDLVTLGGECPWTICPRGLNESSVVYSAGVGGDISFERELVERFDCEVWLLDPSEVGIKTMELEENRHHKIHFEALALVNAAGRSEKRAHVAEDGFVTMGTGEAENEALPSTSLERLMQANGHSRIDLLKMDIEGFEYGVLDQIFKERIPVSQICVELHQRPHLDIPKRKKIEAILKLRMRGFGLVHQVYCDHTFLRKGNEPVVRG